MKFKTKEDIEAPIDYMFAVVSDFDSFQRQALRRGAEVSRLDDLDVPGVGMAWDIAFPFRGKRRQMLVDLVDFDSPNKMLFDSRMQGMAGHMLVDLMALSRTRTRMTLEIDLRPETLSARLLVQSIKLARGSMDKRFKLRVAEFGKGVEDRYSRVG
ncbi:SRPBCC family protein [Alisedimentitalea sp. MJ-SS2]|uniref:SRPBCC family protein n=1 Tax=Aliisedimentitalea sp. MJ-SS2 TaxID=3049795 RepID=UPI00290AAFD8|nr:SRPBCC family protein [Alisedimentitalea sp. MJ-SS2]MDU8928099.1 SRPBCC family protein [Alisedimentitalea sp. MJ-SS2]